MGDILGRTNIKPILGPLDTNGIDGDVALLGRLFPGDTNNLIVILNVKAPEGSTGFRHKLFVGIAEFGSDFFIPKDQTCWASRSGPFGGVSLPDDLPAGGVEHASGQPIPIDKKTFFQSLGGNVSMGGRYFGQPFSGDTLTVLACFHPKTGLQLIGSIQPFSDPQGFPYRVSDRAFPWQNP